MVKLWIFRLKTGLGNIESVPYIYRIPVYVGAINQRIIQKEDIPIDYIEKISKYLGNN